MAGQEAVEKLQAWSSLMPPVTMAWPSSGVVGAGKHLSWAYTLQNKVHPVPGSPWRHTRSSSSSSNSEDSWHDNEAESAGLINAAICLLKDATLDRAAQPSNQQQNRSHIVARLPAKDWDAFVVKLTAVQPRAVASPRLHAMRNAVPSLSARMVFQSQVSQLLGVSKSTAITA